MLNKSLLLILILIASILGFVYVSSGSGYGAKLSCEEKKILSFGKTPAPAMEMVPSFECYVSYTMEIDNLIVCSGNLNIEDIDYVGCKNLKNYESKPVDVKVEFYNYQTKEFIGKDQKQFIIK